MNAINVDLLNRTLEQARRREAQQLTAVETSTALQNEASGQGLHSLAARQRQIRTRQTIALDQTRKEIAELETLLKTHSKQLDAFAPKNGKK